MFGIPFKDFNLLLLILNFKLKDKIKNYRYLKSRLKYFRLEGNSLGNANKFSSLFSLKIKTNLSLNILY